jgi:glycosyltransferase involved in cell wall biosynthesis
MKVSRPGRGTLPERPEPSGDVPHPTLQRVVPAPVRDALRSARRQAVRGRRSLRRRAATARRRVRAIPTSPEQARNTAERLLDSRIIGTERGRRALLASWRARTHLPGADANLAYGALGLGRRLARKGHPRDAIAVYGVTEAVISDPDQRLLLTVQRSALDLRLGHIPSDLWERIADLLDAADRALAAGLHTAAGSRLQEAFNLAFHRTLHFEDQPSPLAIDPEIFLAPFRASKAFGDVIRPSGLPRPARPPVAGRPRRLLVTTFMNWNFVADIVKDYEATEGVEVRTLDLRDMVDGPWRAQPVDLVQRRLRQAYGMDDVVPPPEVREVFDWADTVFVEWGHRALPWVSLLQDLQARVVARVHSYEAFTPMPMHTDWSGVDDVVFVSPHIRALVEASVPALAEGPRLHTIPNRNLLSAFALPKYPGSEHTLALVGWNNVTKDPQWALDLLEYLREHDDRWRLRLVGDPFPISGLTTPAMEYRDALNDRIHAFGDAVEQPGFTDDVPEALRHVGVILSSSRREGTHEGMLQGVASGAFPVVRNWPYVARWGGAATIVPDGWIVDTAQEGARMLLKAAEDDTTFAERRAAMAEWTIARYDWSVVRPQLDELLLRDGS